ncbi:MAG: hypothetical protein K2J80_10770 [Oscillospiraceae bacterium]|nr:hypothetical protein [Oscillospiraceae bacterium]
MKKIIFGIAAIVLIAAGFAAVILIKLGNVPDGFNEIKKARGRDEKLDSARLVMTDASSGEIMMSFCFYINSDNEMILDYDDPRDDLHAYSDGKQYYYKSGGEWTAITPKDEEYIHNIYNRKYRYPYARGTVFFLDGTAVSEATVTENGGVKTITYVYDCEKLNESSVKKLDNVSAFSKLTCVYTLNDDGYLTRFAEKGSITDADGVAADVDILLEVTDMNDVRSIDIPFD